MMVDFAVFCMELEQNNAVVTVVNFNTEKKTFQLKGCFTISKYSKNTSCPILCLPLKGSAYSSVKQYTQKMVVFYSHHPGSLTGFLHKLWNTLNWPCDRLTYFCSFENCKISHSHPFILLFFSLFITTFKDTFQLSYKLLTNKGNFGSDFWGFWSFS